MSAHWRILQSAAYYGRRQDMYETTLDNMRELAVPASQQLIEQHNAAVLAAFALGLAMGRAAGDE